MNKTKLGWIRQIGPSEFSTQNGRIVIKLINNRGHIHIKVTGPKRLTALSSVKAELSKLELLALANYVYSRLESDFDIRQVARKFRHMNYAEVFGSMWLGGAE